MFFAAVLSIVLSAITADTAQAQGNPHLVFGDAVNNQLIPCPQLELSSWLAQHADNVISDQFTNGEFEVEVADFNIAWLPGDELLIALTDPQTAQSDTISVILNEAPWQQLGYVHLDAVSIQFDNPENALLQLGETEPLSIRLEYDDGAWSQPFCTAYELQVEGDAIGVLSPCLIEAVELGESIITVVVFDAVDSIQRTVVSEGIVEQNGPASSLFTCSSTMACGNLRLQVLTPFQLSFYDMLGRRVLQRSLRANGQLNLQTGLCSGTYIVVGDNGRIVQSAIVHLVR